MTLGIKVCPAKVDTPETLTAIATLMLVASTFETPIILFPVKSKLSPDPPCIWLALVLAISGNLSFTLMNYFYLFSILVMGTVLFLPITLNVLEGNPNETAAPVLTPIVKTLVASTDVLLIVKPLEAKM